MQLDGKVAIVTGAASGFGEGIARRFAAEGARIVVADVDIDAGRTVAESLGSCAIATETDVTQGAAVASMVDHAQEAFGGLDILVNNAGWTHKRAPLQDVPEDEFDRVYATNVKSLYLTAVHGVPALKQRGGGVILNIASTAGVRPRAGLTWYNGSKGAVITLTKSMAGELAACGIRVCAINPVIGETGLLEAFMGETDTPEARRKFTATIPLGRMSTPRDVASAAAFLCSAEADFLTGVCLDVDGGRCI